MSILDKNFRYTPAAKTDIRKTIRREQARLKALAEERAAKVAPIKREAKK